MRSYGETYYAGMYEDACLMHYGIKGMKWGVRRNRNAFSLKAAGNRFSAKTMSVYEKMNRKLGENTKNKSARSTFKSSANAFKQAKEYALKKADKAQAEANAKRDAKRAKKQAYKDNYKDVRKNSTVGDRLIYNTATRKKAAKYMTNKGMSREEAIKKTKREAWRNTAAVAGAYGAAVAGKAAYNAYKNRSTTPRLPGTKMKKVAKNVFEEVAVGRKRRRR